jgi:hypothetical protein
VSTEDQHRFIQATCNAAAAETAAQVRHHWFAAVPMLVSMLVFQLTAVSTRADGHHPAVQGSEGRARATCHAATAGSGPRGMLSQLTEHTVTLATVVVPQKCSHQAGSHLPVCHQAGSHLPVCHQAGSTPPSYLTVCHQAGSPPPSLASGAGSHLPMIWHLLFACGGLLVAVGAITSTVAVDRCNLTE